MCGWAGLLPSMQPGSRPPRFEPFVYHGLECLAVAESTTLCMVAGCSSCWLEPQPGPGGRRLQRVKEALSPDILLSPSPVCPSCYSSLFQSSRVFLRPGKLWCTTQGTLSHSCWRGRCRAAAIWGLPAWQVRGSARTEQCWFVMHVVQARSLWSPSRTHVSATPDPDAAGWAPCARLACQRCTQSNMLSMRLPSRKACDAGLLCCPT